ncbi:hypothetical protein CTAYLR_003751 [Chrysophaeum taylorii]|uniref:glutamine--tRNA ligase n=1 Tax=Chrysophaeum taylorii TaxID=2483200 RepID=A0AAD7XLL6_9STRA|nr:hypothetical protein CTAYLR_003751 [Chrysophaeum taylorii]
MMLHRGWWAASPSSKWLAKKRDEGSPGVWAVEKRRDPLLGRSLSHWADLGREDVPQLCGNPAEVLAEHYAINDGVVRTRFPPEPNGYLHIGHAKSMNMNFKLAFEKLGIEDGSRRECVFRYDDTNPEKENREFVESLRKDVAWMGWSPIQVTHTSDYFEALYAMALELIRAGKAYVCEQSPAEIEACRGVAKARAALRRLRESNSRTIPEDVVVAAREDTPGAHESPYRDRPVSENLASFEKMRRGQVAEGAMTLRLKMDNDATNFNMFDQVAYRIKFSPHPNTGDAWCVYPTYDYTHCVVDSLEHVDYSICTLEFETRRESYYWVLDALDIYRPKVFEMSRLNITYTVLSKRKLAKLVDTKVVRGWDDPRMPTISGLRRRGYSPAALNSFCDDIGVTRNENLIDYVRLQHFARLDLEPRAPRRMAVREPFRIDLDGPDEVFRRDYHAQGYTLRLSRTIYIDRKDYRDVDSPDFFGLAPQKIVRLRHAVNIRYESDGKGVVVDDSIDPKGKLHWVSEEDAVECELRDYDRLFVVPKIDESKWEKQINPNSEVVYDTALVHHSVKDWAPLTSVQFERLGFYCVDYDGKVFNRTVELRSETAAAAAKGRSRKEEQLAQLAKKEAAKSIDPKDMFKSGPYSQFDADGLPTRDARGAPLSKSLIKKLKKDQAKQKRLFEANRT